MCAHGHCLQGAHVQDGLYMHEMQVAVPQLVQLPTYGHFAIH